MSLLLDARKKLQQAHSTQEGGYAAKASEFSLEEHPKLATNPESETRPIENVRSAGQNLFAAKSPFSTIGRALPNRNLLYALGGTVLLLAAGAAYLWYVDSTSNTELRRPVSAQPVPPVRQIQPAAVTEPAIQNTPTAEAGADLEKVRQAATPPAENTPAAVPQSRRSSTIRQDNNPVRIEQQKTELAVDPLLGDAYLAYHSGRLDEAQQLYLTMLKKDVHNPDALLGLAVIA
ncbi:MAG TPA: hypothetical protein VEP71_02525, partial [Gallionella sp.]|nr:hypothetical protein [Gallionella sp.]